MAGRTRFSVADLWTPRQALPGKPILRKITKRLGRAWDVDGLERKARVRYNSRLRSTLGRAILDDCSVELNTRLLREHPKELVGVLAHELAHVVVHLRYGRVPPHGLAFRTLMRALNLSDKSTHSLPVAHLKHRRRRYLYLHRCGDCGYSFIAQSVRRNYYCLACGPEMTWNILRAPRTKSGGETLKAAMVSLKRGECVDQLLHGGLPGQGGDLP